MRKAIRFMRPICFLALALGLSASVVTAVDDLERQFANPPDAARPHVF